MTSPIYYILHSDCFFFFFTSMTLVVYCIILQFLNLNLSLYTSDGGPFGNALVEVLTAVTNRR